MLLDENKLENEFLESKNSNSDFLVTKGDSKML
jgi:hypothetical protein